MDAKDRRLTELRKKVEQLKLQAGKMGPWYAIRLGWIITISGPLIDFAFEYFGNGASLESFLQDVRWVQLPVRWAFWSFLIYMLHVKGIRNSLAGYRKELEMLEEKEALRKEAAP